MNAEPSAIRHWPWLAAIASGGLLAWSFPPADQGWLAWFALTPLVCAVWFGGEPLAFGVWRLKFGVPADRSGTVETPNAKGLRSAALGYVAGLTFFTATFGWLGELAPLFANPWLRALPLLLALYLGLYLAFWAWFLAWIKPPDFLRPGRNLACGALVAAAWVAQEWVRGWLFSGFGWNALGVALHGDLAMIQIVAFTGVPGLSWLVAFGNAMAVLVVRRLLGDIGPHFLRRMRWEFSATVALVALVWAFGARTLLRGDAPAGDVLRVAAIQANIPQREKFDPAQEEEIFARFDRLTGLALALRPEPQLIVWPESATPRPLFGDQANHDFVFAQAGRSDAALLLGTTDLDALGDDYNVAVLLTDRGEHLQMYRKMHLVPFGEYLPLRPLLGPIAGGLVPGDFAPGRSFTQFEMGPPTVRLSTLICFEDTLSALSRGFVLEGAQILVNITNDGWFARSAAARQHLVNAIFRAVENRRPLLRCANTGVTGLVQRTGFFEQWIPEFEEGIAVREITVPREAPTTFFTRHGDLVSPVSAGAVALGLALGGWRRRAAVANSPVRA